MIFTDHTSKLINRRRVAGAAAVADVVVVGGALVVAQLAGDSGERGARQRVQGREGVAHGVEADPAQAAGADVVLERAARVVAVAPGFGALALAVGDLFAGQFVGPQQVGLAQPVAGEERGQPGRQAHHPVAAVFGGEGGGVLDRDRAGIFRTALFYSTFAERGAA